MNFSTTQVYSAKWCVHLTPMTATCIYDNIFQSGLLWLAISEVPSTTHWLSCLGPEVPQYIMAGTYIWWRTTFLLIYERDWGPTLCFQAHPMVWCLSFSSRSPRNKKQKSAGNVDFPDLAVRADCVHGVQFVLHPLFPQTSHDDIPVNNRLPVPLCP